MQDLIIKKKDLIAEEAQILMHPAKIHQLYSYHRLYRITAIIPVNNRMVKFLFFSFCQCSKKI
jgi:hypothetical protein